MVYTSQIQRQLPLPARPHAALAHVVVSCRASRSPHFVSRAEAIKGVSNRFIFSRFYIYLYLGMAALSCVDRPPLHSLPRANPLLHRSRLTTVVLSLLSDCPTFTFYMLEIIVNTAMIAEVSIRLVAFGKVSPPSSSQPAQTDP